MRDRAVSRLSLAVFPLVPLFLRLSESVRRPRNEMRAQSRASLTRARDLGTAVAYDRAAAPRGLGAVTRWLTRMGTAV